MTWTSAPLRGSGGAVRGLIGELVAVNATILREFDGFNLGVPIKYARQLLMEVRQAG